MTLPTSHSALSAPQTSLPVMLRRRPAFLVDYRVDFCLPFGQLAREIMLDRRGAARRVIHAGRRLLQRVDWH
jgi:hypothetical protein